MRRIYAAEIEARNFSELRWASRLASLLHGDPARRDLLFGRFGQALCEAMADVIAGTGRYSDLCRPRHAWRRLAAFVAGGRADRSSLGT